MLQGFGRVRAGGARRATDQRPAPRIVHAADKRPASASAAARLAFAGGGGQCAQAGKTVGIHQTGTDQFQQRGFQLAAQETSFVHQLVEKQRAVFTQRSVDFLRLGRQRAAVGRIGQAAPHAHLAARQYHHRRAALGAGAVFVGQAHPDPFAAAA